MQATPEPATPPTPEVEIGVLATGLQDPRYVAIDASGVYFTEAGTGGDEDVFEITSEGTPAAETPISHRGTTGRLSRLETDGAVTVVADEFVSYTFGGNGEIVGPAGLALDGNGKAYVAVGAPGPFIGSIERTGEEAALFEVDIATGEKRLVADLGQYEIEHNPDPMTIDSNPYGVALREGIAYVADAGGNDILAVDIASGEITTFAVSNGIAVPFLGEEGNPQREGKGEIDSVPSGVELGPDDRLYVTYVTGGPFPIGFSRVDAFSPAGELSEFASGLTMLTDIAFSSDGTAYVAIMAFDLVNGGPGKIVRIAPDGVHMVVVDNLHLPNGIAFDAEDNLYVTHNASLFPVGGGELLKITGVTTAIGVPLTGPADTATAAVTSVADVVEAPKEIHVVMGDMFFDPVEVTIPANTEVLFTFENAGYMQHDYLVGGTEFYTGVLGGGQTGEMVISLPAGTYETWCTQIGHRQAGMRGKLIVE